MKQGEIQLQRIFTHQEKEVPAVQIVGQNASN
jgi:hypothetical protein